MSNVWLENAASGLGSPENPEDKKVLLTRLEEVKVLSAEISLLFEGEEGACLSAFVEAYASLLKQLYKYQLLLIHMEENSKSFSHTLEQASEAVDELSYRNDLEKAISDAGNTYNRFIQAEKRSSIEGQIKVFKDGRS